MVRAIDGIMKAGFCGTGVGESFTVDAEGAVHNSSLDVERDIRSRAMVFEHDVVFSLEVLEDEFKEVVFTLPLPTGKVKVCLQMGVSSINKSLHLKTRLRIPYEVLESQGAASKIHNYHTELELEFGKYRLETEAELVVMREELTNALMKLDIARGKHAFANRKRSKLKRKKRDTARQVILDQASRLSDDGSNE